MDWQTAMAIPVYPTTSLGGGGFKNFLKTLWEMENGFFL